MLYSNSAMPSAPLANMDNTLQLQYLQDPSGMPMQPQQQMQQHMHSHSRTNSMSSIDLNSHHHGQHHYLVDHHNSMDMMNAGMHMQPPVLGQQLSSEYLKDPNYSPGNSSTHSMTAGNGQKTKAKRVSKACDHCVKRKIKCSGEQPCSSCSRLKYECLYTLPRSRKGRLSNHEKHRRDSLISQNNMTLEILNPGMSSGSGHSRKLSQASLETLDPLAARAASSWNHDTFTCLMFVDLDGNGVPFLDIFFRLVRFLVSELFLT